MHDREVLIAKELRIQLVMFAEPVPSWLAETAARQLTAEVGRPSPLPGKEIDEMQEDVEALKREQAEIQKRTIQRREALNQEHQERVALEKVQGLAKVSELTGGSRKRAFRSEVLAEFLGASGKDDKQIS